jgi:hypothetical protein
MRWLLCPFNSRSTLLTDGDRFSFSAPETPENKNIKCACIPVVVDNLNLLKVIMMKVARQSDLGDFDDYGSEEEDEVGAFVDDASHQVQGEFYI